MSRLNICEYIVLNTENPLIKKDGSLLLHALKGTHDNVIKHPIKCQECLYKDSRLRCVSNYTFCASGFYFFEFAFKCDVTDFVTIRGFAGNEYNGKIQTRDSIYEVSKVDGKGIVRFHFPIQKEDVDNIDNIGIYFNFPDDVIETNLCSQIDNNLRKIKMYISELHGVNEFSFPIPSEDEEKVIVPLECSYSQRFFAKVYLLQNFTVLSQIISSAGLLQYQIPIGSSDEELMLLIAGDHYLKNFVWDEQGEIGKSLLLPDGDAWNHHSRILCLLDETNELLQSNNMIRNSVYCERYNDCKKELSLWIRNNLDIAYTMYKKVYGKVIWKSEYRLFQFIRLFFPDAIYQYRSDWLGEQSLDIYIPSISSCIEYHGEQHFVASSYFGGETKLVENKERDTRKEEKCVANGVKYVVWAYNLSVTYEHVRDFLFINFHSLVKTDEWTIAERLSEGVPFKLSDLLITEENLPFVERSKKMNPEEYIPLDVIRQYDSSGAFVAEYNSASEAAAKYHIGVGSIYKSISGQRKRAGDFFWRREPRESYPRGIELSQMQSPDPKINWTNENVIVNQISVSTGEILNTYESINAAAKAVGIDRKGISDVLSGKQRSAGGFFWAKEN